MDDEIPPEEDEEPFSSDSENPGQDEFPEDNSGEEFLDSEFDVKEAIQEPQEQSAEPEPLRPSNTESPRPEMDDKAPSPNMEEGMGFDDEEMSSLPPPEEVALDQVDVSSVPVQIDLELTRVKVSLAELQRMQPGQKVPIDVNPRMVNLVVADKLIGKGEIVNIGDAACVKVIELYK